MKPLKFAIPLFMLMVVAFGCQVNQPGEAGEPSSLQAAAAVSDSVRQSDPWLKYDYDQRRGKQLFEQYCVVCHGKTGEGDGFNSYNLDPRPHSLADSTYMAALSDGTLADVISHGGRGVNKSVLMPAYGETLSQDQIQYLIKYIRTLARAGE